MSERERVRERERESERERERKRDARRRGKRDTTDGKATMGGRDLEGRKATKE